MIPTLCKDVRSYVCLESDKPDVPRDSAGIGAACRHRAGTTAAMVLSSHSACEEQQALEELTPTSMGPKAAAAAIDHCRELREVRVPFSTSSLLEAVNAGA